jgi:beta-phosphoglucomutase
MLRMVIFDFDGVLADSEPAHFEMFRRILRREGIDLDWGEYCEKYIGYTDLECIEHILTDRHQAVSPERISQLAKDKSLEFRRYIERNSVIFPGVRELIDQLKSHKVMQGICSGALRSEIQFILSQTGIDSYFPIIVAADDVRHGKPHPEGYQLALRRANESMNGQNPIQPGECVVIEDSSWGIRAAKEANMACVAVETSCAAIELRAADLIVKDLTQIDVSSLQELAAVSRN